MNPGLLGRVVELEVGVAGAPGRRITGLRIGFSAKHSASKALNEATISVFNVAPETLALAQRKGATVRLLAGYASTAARQIFEGAILKDGIRVRHQGPDRVLEISAADGLAGFQRLVTLSAVKGVTVESVLVQVLAQTGWARGVVSIDTTTTLPQGITHVGTVAPVLDRLTSAIGAVWHVRDGALYITPLGASVPEEVPVFSSRAGTLVGSPQPTEDGIEITALLDAGMRPGRRFVLESDAYAGTYVAGDVTFAGDSGWETPFYVTVLGRPE